MHEPPNIQPQIEGSGVSLHDVISSLQPHQRSKPGEGQSSVPFHREHTHYRPVTLELRSIPLAGTNRFPMHPVPEPSTLQEQESDSLANVGSLGPAPLVETNRFPRHLVPEHSNTQVPESDSPVNSAPGPSVEELDVPATLGGGEDQNKSDCPASTSSPEVATGSCPNQELSESFVCHMSTPDEEIEIDDDFETNVGENPEDSENPKSTFEEFQTSGYECQNQGEFHPPDFLYTEVLEKLGRPLTEMEKTQFFVKSPGLVKKHVWTCLICSYQSGSQSAIVPHVRSVQQDNFINNLLSCSFQP